MNKEELNNPMRDQVMSLPQLMRDMYSDLEPKVRTVLSTPEIFSLQNIILTGCGDSYAAACAMKEAFIRLTGIRCEAVKTIDLARYYPEKRLSGSPNNPFVIGISNSGKVARIAEAMERARKHGAFTFAITGDDSSPLAQASERILKLDIPKFPSAPGTRSYMVSLLALYLLAIRIGEVRGKYTMDKAKSMRKEVLSQADKLEALLPAMDNQICTLAQNWQNKLCYDFIGGGIDEPTAFFGMAKVYEATGQFASYINIEEWLHLNFFMKDRENIGTVVIANSLNAGLSRCKETIAYVKELGRPMIVISDKGKEYWGTDCEYVTVPESEYELVTPLTFFAPICLLMGYIQKLRGEKSGRGVEGPWSFSKGAACVRQSEKVIL